MTSFSWRYLYPFLKEYLYKCNFSAIAASAPVAQFDAPCDAFGRIVTADYTAENEACSSAIRSSWASIDNVTSSRKKNIFIDSDLLNARIFVVRII